MTHLPIRIRPAVPACLLALLFLSGCTPGLEPMGTRPKPESIVKILFRIAPQNLDTAGLSGQKRDMEEKVSGNLRGWGYPIEADEDGAGGYSHVMEARVGKVERKSTPAGFSFGVGNSDPRALEFQKADVLPVDCVLYPSARPKETASLYMDFFVGEPGKGPGLLGSGRLSAETYVNHIATVCFNLLEDLKVKRAKPAQSQPAQGQPAQESSSGPAWFPEVRIEVKEKSASPQPRPKSSSTSAATPAKASAPASSPSSAQTAETPEFQAPADEAESEKAPEASPLTTETQVETKEGRKQMIIHNQGAPIILEFGYERR